MKTKHEISQSSLTYRVTKVPQTQIRLLFDMHKINRMRRTNRVTKTLAPRRQWNTGESAIGLPRCTRSAHVKVGPRVALRALRGMVLARLDYQREYEDELKENRRTKDRCDTEFSKE